MSIREIKNNDMYKRNIYELLYEKYKIAVQIIDLLLCIIGFKKNYVHYPVETIK
jgi:hypothetical protein